MPASIPASMVNQMYADLGIPNRFNLISSRFSQQLPVVSQTPGVWIPGSALRAASE